MRQNRFIHLGVCLMAVAFVQCGGSKTPEPTTPPPEPPVAEPPSDMTPAAATQPEPTEPAPAPEPAPPKAEPSRNPQIISIVSAANQSEIDQAKIAMKKGKNARVKKFAAMMIQHHGDAQKKQEKVAKKLALTPADSGLLTEMKTGADATTEKLNAATGPDFDRTYMDAQVTAHQQLLDAIDNKLMTSVEAADLKTLLTDIRPVVEKHLTEAKDVQQVLANAPAPTTTPPPKK